MPSKNTIKLYAPDSFYHVYNRGWNYGELFLEEFDYWYFEGLLARRLALQPTQDPKGREYIWLRDKIDLNAYCLMPNHFHFLVYQRDERAITQLLQSICTAYTMYFNKKYKRRGTLFETRFKAVLIYQDEQLQHITRYIHLNHKDFRSWPYSSYRDYLDPHTAREWIQSKAVLELFKNVAIYREFVDDYETLQRENDQLKQSILHITQ